MSWMPTNLKRFGPRRGPFARPRQRLVRWTGETTQIENLAAAGALQFATIVAPADYRQQATLEAAGVTCLAIKGCFSLRATVLGAIAHVGIINQDANLVPTFGADNDPGAAAWLFNGDVMYWYCCVVPIDTTHIVPFDVQAKRRLVDSNVNFVVSARAQAVTWQMGARALLKGG